jgi:hypothetical protein
MKQGGNSFILVASVIKNVMLVTPSKWEMYGMSVDFPACVP